MYMLNEQLAREEEIREMQRRFAAALAAKTKLQEAELKKKTEAEAIAKVFAVKSKIGTVGRLIQQELAQG